MGRVGGDARQGGRDLDRERQPLLDHQRLDLTRDVDHEGAEREGLGVDVEPASGEAGEVEDLVHERLQVLGGALDPLHRPDHAGTELAVGAVAQEVHEPDDRGQGGAKLVRDVGEELRLGAIGAREFEGEVFELGAPFPEPAPLRPRREEEDHQGDGQDRREHPSEHRPPDRADRPTD